MRNACSVSCTDRPYIGTEDSDFMENSNLRWTALPSIRHLTNQPKQPSRRPEYLSYHVMGQITSLKTPDTDAILRLQRTITESPRTTSFGW